MPAYSGAAPELLQFQGNSQTPRPGPYPGFGAPPPYLSSPASPKGGALPTCNVSCCHRLVNPGRQQNGRPFSTCCKSCAVSHGTKHDRACQSDPLQRALKLHPTAAIQRKPSLSLKDNGWQCLQCWFCLERNHAGFLLGVEGPSSQPEVHQLGGSCLPSSLQEKQRCLKVTYVFPPAVVHPVHSFKKTSQRSSTRTAIEAGSIATGILLGTMCGDVLGAPFERMPESEIRASFPQGPQHFCPSNRGHGCYTDDTEV
eukprot:scaffold4115_cov17-Prasinocladus_malaysianus.AAC.2